MLLTKTILNEGPTKIVVHFYLEGQADDNEKVNEVLLDPFVDFSPQTRTLKPAITQIWSSLSWFDLLLKFDDNAPQPAWVITRDSGNYHDFRYLGGLKDRSNLDGEGKIYFSTNGFHIGSIGTFVVEFKKD